MSNEWDEKESKLFKMATNSKEKVELSPLEGLSFSYLMNSRFFKKDHRSLTIGPGSGHLEKYLLKEGMLKSFYIVEPDLNYFSELIHFSGVEGGQNTSFQEFHGDKTFESIISINSWYYLGRDLNSLKKCNQLLSDQGQLLISLGSEKTIGNKIQKMFREKELYITGEELSGWLNSKGVKHNFELDSTSVPLQKFVGSGVLTDAGEQWASFIIGKNTDELSLEDQSRLVKSITDEASGKGELPYVWSFIVIDKANLPFGF